MKWHHSFLLGKATVYLSLY